MMVKQWWGSLENKFQDKSHSFHGVRLVDVLNEVVTGRKEMPEIRFCRRAENPKNQQTKRNNDNQLEPEKDIHFRWHCTNKALFLSTNSLMFVVFYCLRKASFFKDFVIKNLQSESQQTCSNLADGQLQKSMQHQSRSSWYNDYDFWGVTNKVLNEGIMSIVVSLVRLLSRFYGIRIQ